MPDTPKTLRDVLMQAGVDKWILTWPEGPTLADAESIAGVSLDALIGCQGRVVYTEEDVEAAADAAMTAYFDRVIRHRVPWQTIARAAITAAGGVMADEGPLRLQEYPEPQTVLVDGGLIELGTGDILYIVRAKEE